MEVRDGMNTVVVTIGPGHTVREAAPTLCLAIRRAASRTVWPGPGIFTERDLLHADGAGKDIDAELVGDHLSAQLTYAHAGWSLEQAAEQMVRGAFRHIVVLEGSEVVGILSMRDIVRCWTTAGATSEMPSG